MSPKFGSARAKEARGSDRPSQEAFDRVEILEESGQHRSLDRAQFYALKLDERVRYILGKRLRFYRRDAEVPLKDALGT
jgi:hypothetical protein